ncbi:hypothetical protein PG996_015387 [Apiospora saccharicola]|uniref:Uncharacterized protein n=1 Tax=Apiospora saccharicola TaxID=335842 RepID=A0ABR1TKZ1_9PEZI
MCFKRPVIHRHLFTSEHVPALRMHKTGIVQYIDTSAYHPSDDLKMVAGKLAADRAKYTRLSGTYGAHFSRRHGRPGFHVVIRKLHAVIEPAEAALRWLVYHSARGELSNLL